VENIKRLWLRSFSAKAAPESPAIAETGGRLAETKQRRADAGLSQIDLAARLGLKYYTFISQVENGF